jgi:tRNA A-37 threonylcarbamoyl transferase component Bud32
MMGCLHPDGSNARWRQLLGILRDVAAGLAHLHAHGVVHGSLTPLNVMLFEVRALGGLDVAMLDLFTASLSIMHSLVPCACQDA